MLYSLHSWKYRKKLLKILSNIHINQPDVILKSTIISYTNYYNLNINANNTHSIEPIELQIIAICEQ